MAADEPPTSAIITVPTLFGDSYIVVDGANTYSVLDVYIKTTTSKDVLASVFGNSNWVAAYTQNQGTAFLHSGGAGANSDWLPAAGKTNWDSFVTCGNRDQASAATTLNMQLDTLWAAGNGSAIAGVASGCGWYPAVGSSTSTNPYARSGFYNGNTTSINLAKTESAIAGNGIVAGQNLNNHWMIGRFTINVTGVAAPQTMTLKFCTAGRNYASESATTYSTITGATSASGRLTYTLAFAANPCLPACPSDLDGNRVVDGSDLALQLLDFGPCPGCATDIDGSGAVDSGDIALTLIDFGSCEPCPCPPESCSG